MPSYHIIPMLNRINTSKSSFVQLSDDKHKCNGVEWNHSFGKIRWKLGTSITIQSLQILVKLWATTHTQLQQPFECLRIAATLNLMDDWSGSNTVSELTKIRARIGAKTVNKAELKKQYHIFRERCFFY